MKCNLHVLQHGPRMVSGGIFSALDYRAAVAFPSILSPGSASLHPGLFMENRAAVPLEVVSLKDSGLGWLPVSRVQGRAWLCPVAGSVGVASLSPVCRIPGQRDGFVSGWAVWSDEAGISSYGK